jgi:hypothetical protein
LGSKFQTSAPVTASKARIVPEGLSTVTLSETDPPMMTRPPATSAGDEWK